MMKDLLLICMLAAAPMFAAAQTKPAAPAPAAAAPAGMVVAGEVLEVKDVEGYTYLRLKTAQGETWAAVPTSPVKKGAKVTVQNAMVMKNFESKALKKTFDNIVFGTLASGQPGAPSAQQGAAPHPQPANAPEVADVKVPKATGANARTVAELMAKPAEMKDKPVLLRGKVVKYNGGIMGKNWIHLRDGSGSAADKNNDVLVTSKEEAKVGDVVTAKGTVRTDKDFGAGYTYKVLIEDATLQR
jgi:hypothetical protein